MPTPRAVMGIRGAWLDAERADLTMSVAHRQNTHKTLRVQNVPIYLPGKDKPIGYVGGQTFRKNMVASKHMLRNPRAIGSDLCVLDDAERAGATLISVTDSESGHTYVAPIATMRKYGFPVVRGHGRQIALALDYWSIDGETPAAEQRAAATNQERLDLQLGLFGGGE